jgi:hypothetical protein
MESQSFAQKQLLLLYSHIYERGSPPNTFFNSSLFLHPLSGASIRNHQCFSNPLFALATFTPALAIPIGESMVKPNATSDLVPNFMAANLAEYAGNAMRGIECSHHNPFNSYFLKTLESVVGNIKPLL